LTDEEVLSLATVQSVSAQIAGGLVCDEHMGHEVGRGPYSDASKQFLDKHKDILDNWFEDFEKYLGRENVKPGAHLANEIVKSYRLQKEVGATSFECMAFEHDMKARINDWSKFLSIILAQRLKIIENMNCESGP
jgi:hypothetical protein